MRPILTGALAVLTIAAAGSFPALAQDAAADRMRASEDALRQAQVQQQINDLQNRQSTLEIQQQSQQILRDMQAQSARAAAAPIASPTIYYYASPVRTAEPVATPEQKAQAKAEKRAIKKAKAKKKA